VGKKNSDNSGAETAEQRDAAREADRQSQIEQLIEMVMRHRENAALATERIERDGHNLRADMLELWLKQLRGGRA